jgi:excisionase family DNA binding protein
LEIGLFLSAIRLAFDSRKIFRDLNSRGTFSLAKSWDRTEPQRVTTMTIPVSAPQQIAFRIRDAARATSLSERTIWAAIQRGDLPAAKVGRALLIKPSDLESWVDRSSKPRGGEAAKQG